MINVPVLVKDALREGDKRKNYRIVVYQADGETVDFTIDNDNLVSESVAFDERMCSDTNLKFGLCEGTSVEFQYFGYGNITGRRIQVFLDVQYTDTDGTDKWHSIPMGWFTVDETSRQASTGIRKVSAYNKLKSEYLNASANSEIIDYVSQGEDGDDNVSFYKIIESLLEGYSIEEYKAVDAEINFNSIVNNQSYSIPTKNVTDTIQYLNIAHVWVNNYVDPQSPDYEKYGYEEVNILSLYQASLEQYSNLMSRLVHIQSQTSPDEWVTVQYAIENNLKIEVIDYSYPSPSPSNTRYEYAGELICGYTNFGYLYQVTDDVTTDVHLIKRLQVSISFIYDKNISVEWYAIGTNAMAISYWNHWKERYDWDIKVYRLEVPELSYKTLNLEQAMALPDVTLRDLQTSVYETVCQYGKLDRVTDLFSGVELNNSRLYPADNLYPANTLYPNSTSERSDPAMYEKLWADEGNIRSFRYLIITYKGVEQDDQGNLQEVEKKLQRTVDEHGTDDYNMSDNWIFKNLVWSDSDIGDYADAIDIGGLAAETAKRCQGSMTREEMLRFLSYFDTKNFTPRISCAVLASSGLADETCPARLNLVPFNNLATPADKKEYIIEPYMGHSYPKNWFSKMNELFNQYK